MEVELPYISFGEECRLAKENNLTECLGNIFEQVPKQVLATTQCPEDKSILYLCRWHQDFEDKYFVPSWV